MKKNYTFNLDSQIGDVLKCLKYTDKRSINNEVEFLIEYYVKSEFGMDISEFLKEYSILI